MRVPDPPHRRSAAERVRVLGSHSATRIETSSKFHWALALYADKPDKAWSLNDGLSLIVMQGMNTTSTCTADDHFLPAGFWSLLSDLKGTFPFARLFRPPLTI